MCVAVVHSCGAGLSEDQQGGTFGEFTQFNRNELLSGGDLISNCFYMHTVFYNIYFNGLSF